jgi:hypothetical protein
LADNREEFSALPGEHLFHENVFPQVFYKLENDLPTQVLVGDFPAVEHDFYFYFVPFGQEFFRLVFSDFYVVFADGERQPDAFDVNLFLVGFSCWY